MPIIPIRIFSQNELGRIAAASIREFSSEVLHTAALDVACTRMAEMSAYNVTSAIDENPGLVGLSPVSFEDIRDAAISGEIRDSIRNPTSFERKTAVMDFLALQANIGVLTLTKYSKIVAIGNDMTLATMVIATLPEVRMKLIISPINARLPTPLPSPP